MPRPRGGRGVTLLFAQTSAGTAAPAGTVGGGTVGISRSELRRNNDGEEAETWLVEASRGEAEELLKPHGPGTFLVRPGTSSAGSTISVASKRGGPVNHYRVGKEAAADGSEWFFVSDSNAGRPAFNWNGGDQDPEHYFGSRGALVSRAQSRVVAPFRTLLKPANAGSAATDGIVRRAGTGSIKLVDSAAGETGV